MGTEGYEELLRQIDECFKRAEKLPDGSKERMNEIMNAEMLLKAADSIRTNGEDSSRKWEELEIKAKLYEANSKLKKEQIKADIGRASKKLLETALNCIFVAGITVIGYSAERDGSRISKWFDQHSRIGRP